MDLTELQRQSKSDINRHPWETARAKVIAFLLAPKLPVRHLADVGSGDSFLLSTLIASDSALYYTAADPGYAEFVPKIASDGKETVVFQTLLASRAGVPPADLVLLLDVLEHVDDDAALLSALRDNPAIDEHASFLITTPAFRQLFSAHDTLLGHRRRYSRSTLRLLCERNSLTVTRSGYFFFSLLIPRLLSKVLRAKANRGAENWRGGPALTRLISLILWLDFRIGFALSHAGIHLPGLSAYCLCQKSPS